MHRHDVGERLIRARSDGAVSASVCRLDGEDRVSRQIKMISRREAIEAIHAWGEIVRTWGDNTPEGWGFQSSSIEWRMFKGSGGSPEFSLPESAIHLLQRTGVAKERAMTVAVLVSSMPWIQCMCVALKYVHDLDEASIMRQTGATVRELRRHLESAHETIFVALNALKQAA